MCGCSGVRHEATVHGIVFVTCCNCLFTFAPEIDAAAMERMYANGFHGKQEGAPERGWADASFLAPALSMADAPASRVLDFGAGESVVADVLRARGSRVIEVDVAPSAAPHRDRLTGSLFDLKLPRDSFNLVYSFQVFEHLPEPKPYLDELVEVAAPGGLVLIHTDMETEERSSGFSNWWYVMPPDHCSFYRHRTFEVFASTGGCEVTLREPKSVVLRKRAA